MPTFTSHKIQPTSGNRGDEAFIKWHHYCSMSSKSFQQSPSGEYNGWSKPPNARFRYVVQILLSRFSIYPNCPDGRLATRIERLTISLAGNGGRCVGASVRCRHGLSCSQPQFIRPMPWFGLLNLDCTRSSHRATITIPLTQLSRTPQMTLTRHSPVGTVISVFQTG